MQGADDRRSVFPDVLVYGEDVKHCARAITMGSLAAPIRRLGIGSILASSRSISGEQTAVSWV